MRDPIKQMSILSIRWAEMTNSVGIPLGDITEIHDLNILGKTIQAYRSKNNYLYVSIKTLCNILQIDFEDELKHIRSHDLLCKGLITYKKSSDSLNENSTILMRLDLLALWLAYIDLKKIENDIHQELEIYQKGASLLLHEAICSGEISNFECLIKQLEKQDDLLVRAYKETVGLLGIVRTKILHQINENKTVCI